MFRSSFSNLFTNSFSRQGGAALAYLLKDEFTTTEAAPLASPRTCEPGPGTLTIVDTGNLASITGGKLILNDDLTNQTKLYTSLLTSSVGYGMACKFTPRTTSGGGNKDTYFARTKSTSWDSSTDAGIWLRGLFFRISEKNLNGTVPFSVVLNTEYTIAIIARTAGNFYLVKGGVYTEWTLLHVTKLFTGNNHLLIQKNATGMKADVDYWRYFVLESLWPGDFGIADTYIANPSSGTTATHAAECPTEVTWSASAGVTAEFDLRYTDDNNRVVVRCSQSGSTIKILEVVGGVETERASAAQTWTPGSSYRVLMILSGTRLNTFVNDTDKNSYTGLSASLTGNTMRVTASAGTLSDLVVWPGTLSGATLTELERWTA